MHVYNTCIYMYMYVCMYVHLLLVFGQEEVDLCDAHALLAGPSFGDVLFE